MVCYGYHIHQIVVKQQELEVEGGLQINQVLRILIQVYDFMLNGQSKTDQ